VNEEIYVRFTKIGGVLYPSCPWIPISDLREIDKSDLRIEYSEKVVRVCRIGLEGDGSDFGMQKPWKISLDVKNQLDPVATFEIVRINDNFYGICGCTYIELKSRTLGHNSEAS